MLKYKFFATLAAQEFKDYYENLPISDDATYTEVEALLANFQEVYLQVDKEYKQLTAHLFVDGDIKEGSEVASEIETIQNAFGERELELKIIPSLAKNLSYKQRRMWKDLF